MRKNCLVDLRYSEIPAPWLSGPSILEWGTGSLAVGKLLWVDWEFSGEGYSSRAKGE